MQLWVVFVQLGLWQLSVAENLDLLRADDECTSEGSEGCSLEALQLRATAEVEDAQERTDGRVYAMYTYGAVATSKSPLEDLSQPSRSFRGLRCYTETILTGSRQTDIAAIFRQDLYHAKVPTLVLHWKMDSEYFPGAGRPELPRHRRGRAGDIDHHWMKNYIDRLVHLQLQGKDVSHQAPFNYSKQFAVLSFGAYEKAKYWRTGEQATMESLIKRHLHKWNLVAQTQQDTLEAVDNMFLVQNHETLDCVLAFEGTHSFNEFGRNLEGAGDGYCGFQGVHKGYADKLYWLMTFSMPKLRHSLSKCNKVSCTGHSLGGSLCEVFAACANSGRTHDKHYQLQQFTKGKPELMPAVHQMKLSRHYSQ
mmetsp:Transcript_62214/g.136228  ORF Transcript_62214/g.136228 Transcript_62214/m.136228 type:complete len:364 (+) Transcript_62214:81-1172(+)